MTKQSTKELDEMAEFYAKEYTEVYFVRDLNKKCVIAVECAPALAGRATVERRDGQRNIFGYQDLLLSTRLRLDENEFGERMVGYETIGNDTRLSKYEKGIVPEVGAKDIQAGAVISSVQSLSPFERAKMQDAVKAGQKSGEKADYTRAINKKGNIVERFETFEVERIK